jgi:uncharacterized protein YegL
VTVGESLDVEWALTGSVVERSVPTDIVYVMDSSGSLTQANWTTQENFVVSHINDLVAQGHFTKGGTVSVIQFSTTANLRVAPTADHAFAKSKVIAMSHLAGSTYTKAGMQLASDTLWGIPGAADRNQVILLMTDGPPNPALSQNPCPLVSTLLDPREHDTVLIGVGTVGVSSVHCLVDDVATEVLHVTSITASGFDALRPLLSGLLSGPAATNVRITFTVPSQFTITEFDFAGADSSMVGFNGNAVTWTAPELGNGRMWLKLTMTATSCGDDLPTFVGLTYTDDQGAVVSMPPAPVDVVGCSAAA